MKTISPRTWQKEAFKQLNGKPFSLIQAPGGSGKSAMQCMLGAAELMADPKQRQLILIPQRHIHTGFAGHGEPVTFKIDKTAMPWQVTQNICLYEPRLRGRRLREFLCSSEPGVAIATNSALLRAWGRMTPAEKKKAVKRLTIRPDEAHHLSGVFGDGEDTADGDDTEGTQIGAIVREIIGFNEPTAHVCLSTATFFRGDRRAILSEAVRDRFSQYYLAWDEYFPTLGIAELTFDYLTYDPTPINQLCQVVKANPRSHHLVIIPPTNRKFRNGATFAQLWTALSKVCKADEMLDLVTTSKQDANKHKMNQNPDQYRVIVACRLFNEGTDWVPCDIMHNTDSCETSQTLAVQRFFRPLRKHPDKSKVRIINYIPAVSTVMTVDEQREVLSDRFNAILTGLVTNGELYPIFVPRMKTEKDAKDKEPKKESLGELYGADTYHDLLLDMAKQFEKMPNKENTEAATKIVTKLIKDYGVPDGIDQDDLTVALQEQLLRLVPDEGMKAQSLRIRWFDATSIRTQGFDHLWKKADKKSLLFGSENIDASLINKLLCILDNPLSRDEIHDGIKAYFKRTGKRPNFFSGYIDELKITARALNNRLVRAYGHTIAQEVTLVLGGKYTGFVEQVHDILREYAKRGIRLSTTYGEVPEMGLTTAGIDNRLKRQFGTSISAEAEKVLGPYRAELSLVTIKRVLKQYDRAGKPIHKRFGLIPELDIEAGKLENALRWRHNTTLAKLRLEA